MAVSRLQALQQLSGAGFDFFAESGPVEADVQRQVALPLPASFSGVYASEELRGEVRVDCDYDGRWR